MILKYCFICVRIMKRKSPRTFQRVGLVTFSDVILR